MFKAALILGLLVLPNIAGAQPKKMQAAPQSVAVSQDMAAYRSRLDRELLNAGINVEVSIRSTPYTGMLKEHNTAMPALLFFGYLNRVSVYKIAEAINRFDDAKKLGFKMVEFTDRGGNGAWYFDLQKPAPTCSRNLCF